MITKVTKAFLECFRKVLGRMLTKRGHEVMTAATAEEMLGAILGNGWDDVTNSTSNAITAAVAPHKIFSALLVDRFMPKIGGPAAIRLVRMHVLGLLDGWWYCVVAGMEQ